MKCKIMQRGKPCNNEFKYLYHIGTRYNIFMCPVHGLVSVEKGRKNNEWR
jgi:hypothetical protein